MEVNNSKNIIAASINTEGNLIVGDNNLIINLKEAEQYKELVTQLDDLNSQLEKANNRIQKYPDDEEFKVERSSINVQQKAIQAKLDELKNKVIELAEVFTKIEINTERLRLAKHYFEAGKFQEALNVLNEEEMFQELDFLLKEKEELNQKERVNEQLLQKAATEYYILARLIQFNFNLKNRFDKVKEYYRKSLLAAVNKENVFAYAHFLQEHNQYSEAETFYYESLKLYENLAAKDPQAYLADVAVLHNNIGNLKYMQREFIKAEASYREGLKVNREIVDMSRDTSVLDSRDLAGVLINFGSFLLFQQYNYDEAEEMFREALQICEKYVGANCIAFGPLLIGALNSIGTVLMTRGELDEAEIKYKEAIEISKKQIGHSPELLQADTATPLTNLSVLLQAKNDMKGAEEAAREAHQLYVHLADSNPKAYTPSLAKSFYNIGQIQGKLNNYDEAEEALRESLKLRRELDRTNSSFQFDLACSLKSLGDILVEKKKFEEAEVGYNEAWLIYRSQSEKKHEMLQNEMARTAVDLSYFYLKYIPDKEKSLELAKAATITIMPTVAFNSFFNKTATGIGIIIRVSEIVSGWGLDPNTFFKDFLAFDLIITEQ